MKHIRCPGCGAQIYSYNDKLDKDFHASAACRELYFQISYYTLSLKDSNFIHQLIVDSYAAQHSGAKTKPITISFALIGLYLVNERSYTGKKVQEAHMIMANKSKDWPNFKIPEEIKWMTVLDVIQSPNNKKEDSIKKWCKSVWNVWKPEKEHIETLVNRLLLV